MIRVAYICADPGIPVFGTKGASVHVQAMLGAFRRAGADVTLFTPRLGGEPPPAFADLAVQPLPEAGKGDAGVRERRLLAANRSLRRVLRDSGPFDLVYERYSLWSHAGMEQAAASGATGVLEVNAPLIEEQSRHRTLVYTDGATAVARRAFAAASTLVAVSPGVADYLAEFPQAAQRIRVVPNGIDPQRFPASLLRQRQAAASNGKPFTVGFLGTLKPWHGVDLLLSAFARLAIADQALRLLIVGDGPERARLEDAVNRQGLGSRVRFVGAVKPDDVPGWLADMDIGVAPYPAMRCFYFSPLKIHEYMAAGLPVVASRVGHLDQVVADGRTGLLYPAGDVEALSRAILRIRLDAALRERLGTEARSHVLRRHDWAAVAAEVLSLAAAPGRDRWVAQ